MDAPKVSLVLVLLVLYLDFTVNQQPGENEIFLQLHVKYVSSGTSMIQNTTLQKNIVKEMGLTLQDLSDAVLEIEDSGASHIVTRDGRRIRTNSEIKKRAIVSVVNLTIGIGDNENLTMADIPYDDSLIPLVLDPLTWREFPSPSCTLKNISAFVDVVSFVNINNKLVGSVTDTNHEDLEGVIVTTIHPTTCETTYDEIFQTNEFGVYRGLTMAVRNILPGRIVCIFSQSIASLQLNEATREEMTSQGSLFINEFLYGDGWIWIFLKGGQSLLESLVPNVGTSGDFSAPLHLDFNHWFRDTIQSLENPLIHCESWPRDSRWSARQRFCLKNDLIREICDCQNPLQFSTMTYFETKRWTNMIPILIICSNRLHSLIRLLVSLRQQRSLMKNALLLVMDGISEDIRELAYVLDLQIIAHKSEGYGPIRVSRNLRFGLFNGLRLFPEAKSFIILEDDLIVSPDFYDYNQQLAPLFNEDKSIYCVSGFNFLSFPNTSVDPTLTYRIQSHPAYGWMMSRDIIQELLPKWPNKLLFHDWDYFFGSDMMRKDRDCIIPDVNRIYHDCLQTTGVHFKPSWYSEHEYLRRHINHIPDMMLRSPERMKKQLYREDFKVELKRAKAIAIDNVFNITLYSSEGDTNVIFVKMDNKTDVTSFRLLGYALDTWTGLPLFHSYYHTWRLFFKGFPLFVVGVPLSPFSEFLPSQRYVFEAPPGFNMDSLTDDSVVASQIKIVTHRNRHEAKLKEAIMKKYYNISIDFNL